MSILYPMSDSNDRKNLLRHEGSNVSNDSTIVASPPVHQQRHGFGRRTTNERIELLPALVEMDLGLNSSPSSPNFDKSSPQGLGITGVNRNSITRKPVGIARRPTSTPGGIVTTFQGRPSPTSPSSGLPRSRVTPRTPPSTMTTPGSAQPLLSPTWERHDEPPDQTHGDGMQDIGLGGGEDISLRSGRATHRETETRPLPNTADGLMGSAYLMEDSPRHKPPTTTDPAPAGCVSIRDIHTRRGSWLSLTLLALSVYSTFMSFLWAITALWQPRWGRSIYSGGSLTPSTASLLSALLAKTIELSFVTVFVGFLGQVLSRRSIGRKSRRGITIAEMSMRTWVIQPGFMLTHWQTVRFAGWTFLGFVSFVAALGAMLYTTASDALVSPKLKFGSWTDGQLQGLVQTSYANDIFIEATCQTPITADEDEDKNETCLALEFAGQICFLFVTVLFVYTIANTPPTHIWLTTPTTAWYNFESYLTTWAGISTNGTGDTPLIAARPDAVALLYDNTTVSGSWVLASNMTANFYRFQERVVDNVTLAMPHAGVFAAARDPINDIMQPNELDGVGGYEIKASVPSPSVNVMCVNVNEADLESLVYTKWPYATTYSSGVQGQKLPFANWTDYLPAPGTTAAYLNSTPVDDLFQWGQKYTQYPPAFPMFPLLYNTVVSAPPQGAKTIYILANTSLITSNYTLCSLRSFMYPNCSTQHSVSGTAGGSTLVSHCEDPSDPQAYAISVPDSTISLSGDWANLASAWASDVSLNDGIINGNSATARLLTELAIPRPVGNELALPPLKPGMAEGLAALVASTLLMSTTSSTFLHFWQYSSNILDPGDYNSFNASVCTQQYTSGPAQTYQAVLFYPVLLVVALINAFCLVYFVIHSGLLTDFTEPQNLFAIALQSPESGALRGACGAGPEGGMLTVGWRVGRWEAGDGDGGGRGGKGGMEGEHFYVHEDEASMQEVKNSREDWGGESGHSRMSSYSKLSNAKILW